MRRAVGGSCRGRSEFHRRNLVAVGRVGQLEAERADHLGRLRVRKRATGRATPPCTRRRASSAFAMCSLAPKTSRTRLLARPLVPVPAHPLVARRCGSRHERRVQPAHLVPSGAPREPRRRESAARPRNGGAVGGQRKRRVLSLQGTRSAAHADGAQTGEDGGARGGRAAGAGALSERSAPAKALRLHSAAVARSGRHSLSRSRHLRQPTLPKKRRLTAGSGRALTSDGGRRRADCRMTRSSARPPSPPRPAPRERLAGPPASRLPPRVCDAAEARAARPTRAAGRTTTKRRRKRPPRRRRQRRPPPPEAAGPEAEDEDGEVAERPPVQPAAGAPRRRRARAAC